MVFFDGFFDDVGVVGSHGCFFLSGFYLSAWMMFAVP